MPELFPPALSDLIEEIERELRYRAHVYPRLVANGRMTEARSERQIVMMQEVLRRLREMPE